MTGAPMLRALPGAAFNEEDEAMIEAACANPDGTEAEGAVA